MASSQSQPTFAEVVQLMSGQMEPEDETRPEIEPERQLIEPQTRASAPPGMSQMPNPPLVDIGELDNLYSQLGAMTSTLSAEPDAPNDKKGDSDKCQTDDEFQKEAENNVAVKRVIEQIIDKIPKDACGVRPPQHRKEMVKVDSKCPPRTATIRRRLPSPEPDTIERVFVVKAVQDVINIIIEKPSMPPPCCIERTEQEAPLKPLIRHNVVCVQPSGKCPPGTKEYKPLSDSHFQKESGGYQSEQPDVSAFTTPQAYKATPQQGGIEIPITIETPSKTERTQVKYVSEPLSRVERIYYSWPETLEHELPTTNYVRRQTY